jgi:hypothetical protein
LLVPICTLYNAHRRAATPGDERLVHEQTTSVKSL